MAITQAALRQSLSKELDDYWVSAADSDGNAGGTTLIDSTLTEKANDWVSDGTGDRRASTVRVTSGTYDGEEREVSSLDNSTGTVTLDRSAGGKILNAVTYEINHQFTATEKEDAITHACYAAFPALHTQVHDETITFGNYFENGCFAIWTSASYPDYWRVSTITCAEETSVQHTHRGSSSCKLTRAGTDGYLYTNETLVRELLDLEEKSPTFKLWVKTSVSNQVRLAIHDGTDTTYSSYHTGGGEWEELEVTATVAQYVTTVEFRVYMEADTDAYVDDARTTGVGGKYAYDISDLGLVNNMPNQVGRIIDDEKPNSNYIDLRGLWEGPSSDGKLRFRRGIADETKIRITGVGYLTIPTSSTSCNISAPQDRIIIAEAAVYLYELLAGRSASQDTERYEKLKDRWERLAVKRRLQFGMRPPPGTVHY